MKRINALIFLLITAVFSTQAQKLPTGDFHFAHDIHLEIPPCNKNKLRNSDYVLDSMLGFSQILGTWKKDSKNYYAYNQKDQLIIDSLALWSEVTFPGWYPGSMDLFTYLSTGKISTRKELTWNQFDGKWRNDTVKITSFYDADKLVKVTQAYYNSDSLKYVSGTTDSLFYNAAGELISEIIYIPGDNKLVPLGRIFYKYDNSQVSSWLLQVTHDKGLSWKNYSREFLHYQGDILEEAVTEFYNEISSNFEPFSTEEYEYNNEGLLLHRNIYYWDDNSWSFGNRFDLYYSKKVVTSTPNIPEGSQANIIMANPFKGGNIIIEAGNNDQNYLIEIYNAAHQLVLKEDLKGKVLNLPPFKNNGYYIINVSQSGKQLGSKMFVSIH